MKFVLLILVLFSFGFLSAQEEDNIVLVDNNFKISYSNYDNYLFGGFRTGYFFLEQDDSAPPFYSGVDPSSERTKWNGNGFSIGAFLGFRPFRYFQLSFEFSYEPIRVDEYGYEYDLSIYNFSFVPELVIPLDSLYLTLNFGLVFSSYNIERESGYISIPEDSDAYYEKNGDFSTVGVRGGADFFIFKHFFIGFRVSSEAVLISGNSQNIILFLGGRI